MSYVKIRNIDYDCKEIGERIKEIMKERGLKKTTITDDYAYFKPTEDYPTALKMTRQRFASILNGEANLTFSDLFEICNFFNVSLDNVLGESDYTNREFEVIGEYLGFSEKAIKLLHVSQQGDNHRWISFLDYLLSEMPDLFSRLMTELLDACASATPIECKSYLSKTDYGEYVININDKSSEMLKKLIEAEAINTSQAYETIAAIKQRVVSNGGFSDHDDLELHPFLYMMGQD